MKKFQIVKCKCGSIVAACVTPDCYTDKDWLRNLKHHIEEGRVVEDSDFVKLENCVCNKK